MDFFSGSHPWLSNAISPFDKVYKDFSSQPSFIFFIFFRAHRIVSCKKEWGIKIVHNI